MATERLRCDECLKRIYAPHHQRAAGVALCRDCQTNQWDGDDRLRSWFSKLPEVEREAINREVEARFERHGGQRVRAFIQLEVIREALENGVRS